MSSVLLLSATGCGSSNPNISAAESALENQNYEEALASVETEISANPQNAEAYRLKGDILYEQAQSVQAPQRRADLLAEMMTAYEEAVEINPELQGQVDLSLLQAYQQEFGRGIQTYNRADSLQSPETFREAAAYLRGASQIRPDSASAPLYESFAYIRAGEPEQALEPLERAVEAGADSASNYVLLSQLYQQEQQSEEAITLLEEATEVYPDNAELQAQLLNAIQRSGDTERAMTAYEEAIAQNPNNATYRYNYGSMLLNADRYDEAIEQLERAMEIDPNNVNAQYNLGAAYVNKAVGVQEQIVQLDEELSANDELSEQEVQEMESEMETLAEQRTELFRQAIEPLEAAREAVRGGAENTNLNEQQICYSLFQAYVQTNQQEMAQQVQDCAGLNE